MGLDVTEVCSPAAAALERAIEQARAAGEPELAAKLQAMRTRLRKVVADQLAEQLLAGRALPVPPTRANVVLCVELPIWTFAEVNRHTHWAEKYSKNGDQRPVMSMAMRGHANRKGVRVRPPCTVQITRLAPDELDDDNLSNALKHIRDGIADWLAVNDRSSTVHWVCAQELTRKAYGVRIEVLQ